MESLGKVIADQNAKWMGMWTKFQKPAQGSSTATKPTSTTTAVRERPTENVTATVSKSYLKARARSMTEAQARHSVQVQKDLQLHRQMILLKTKNCLQRRDTRHLHKMTLQSKLRRSQPLSSK